MNKLMSSVIPKNTTVNAIVQKKELDFFIVTVNGISQRAKKAFSCLVEPMVDDKVMLSLDGENLYIIYILERNEGLGVEIVSKYGISITAQEGNITLNTQKTINSFADKANIVISEVNFLTKIATLKSKTINIIASTYQGVMDSVTLRHKTLHKFVDGHEEHQSASSRRIIKGSDIHHVEESITTVKGQMKIDASLVNIG